MNKYDIEYCKTMNESNKQVYYAFFYLGTFFLVFIFCFMIGKGILLAKGITVLEEYIGFIPTLPYQPDVFKMLETGLIFWTIIGLYALALYTLYKITER